MKTKWVCEKCENEGIVEHDKHASFFTIYHEVNDQHYQANRFCEWDISKIWAFYGVLSGRVYGGEGVRVFLVGEEQS